MWHIALERLNDGGIELARPIALQQLDQSHGDAAEISAAFCRADQQGPAGWRGLCQANGRRLAARPRHQASAWALRSSRSVNVRAAKNASRTNLMALSTRPFSLPRATATGRGS